MSAPKSLIRVLAAALALLLVPAFAGMTAAPTPGLAEKPQPDVGAADVSAAALFPPEVQVSPVVAPTDYDNMAPAVAYSALHRQFLVVWHRLRADGCRDIWGRRVTDSGQLLGDIAIATGPCPQQRAQPAVVYNWFDDKYLVAWMYYPSGPASPSVYDPNEIWARTVSWDGSSLGPAYQSIVWPNRSFWTPRAAYNHVRNEYLVAWNAVDTTSGQASDVAHAILYADGQRRDGNIISWDGYPHNVDVVYSFARDNYFAVWRRVWSPGDGDILGAFLDTNVGTVVNPPGVINIAISTTDQKEPRVAANDNRYVAVWSEVHDESPYDWEIRGKELDADGNKQMSYEFISHNTDDEVPAVTARYGAIRNFMVVWQSAAAGRNSITGYYMEESWLYAAWLKVADDPLRDNVRPAVAAGRPTYLIAYAADAIGDPTVHSHIYMRRYAPHATYLPVTQR